MARYTLNKLDKKILLHDTLYNATNNKDIPALYQYFNGMRATIVKNYYSSHNTTSHKKDSHGEINDER